MAGRVRAGAFSFAYTASFLLPLISVVPGPSGPYLSLRNGWFVPSPKNCAR